MNHTIPIRVSEELAAWLEDTAAKTGVSQGKILRDQLGTAVAMAGTQKFMRLAGSVKGPKNLLSRKAFARVGRKERRLAAIKGVGDGDGQPVGSRHNEFLYGRKRA